MLQRGKSTDMHAAPKRALPPELPGGGVTQCNRMALLLQLEVCSATCLRMKHAMKHVTVKHPLAVHNTDATGAAGFAPSGTAAAVVTALILQPMQDPAA